MDALNHIRELTCVSVLAMCLENLSCELLVNDHSLKTVDASSSDASPDSVVQKPLSSPSNKKTHKDGHVAGSDPDRFIELQREEIVASLNIAKIHLQLRRMKHNNNFNENIVLTAIPEYRSKTMFTFRQLTDSLPRSSKSVSPHPEPGDKQTAEDIAGFIMFECGLEDILLKACKRKGFETSWPVDEYHRLGGSTHSSMKDVSDTGAICDYQSSQRDSQNTSHSHQSSVQRDSHCGSQKDLTHDDSLREVKHKCESIHGGSRKRDSHISTQSRRSSVYSSHQSVISGN